MKRLHILTLLAVLTLLLCWLLPAKANAATEGYYTYSVSNGEATITDCDESISGDITIPSILGGYPVTSIGYYAFNWCSSLTSITMPDGITRIGANAFASCSNLTSITIPDSVTSIGDYAFYFCSSLTSITIPNSVTDIGYSAFDYCSSLTSIIIPESVTSIGNPAFIRCDSLTHIYVDEDNVCYSSDVYGVLFNKNKTKLIIAPKKGLAGSYTIPDGITDIGYSAFSGCSDLTSITIPDSVTSIGEYAFCDCNSLTSVTFGKNSQLMSIGWGVFDSCSSLTSITIPDSVTSIGEYAFCNCNSLTSVTFGENSQLMSIGYDAFYSCSLTSITIPDSVTDIDNAFSECDSLDFTIYDNGMYLGTTENPYFVLVQSKAKDITSCVLHPETKVIGGSAFSECINLTSVAFSENSQLIRIGDNAFYGCRNLEDVAIPNSVTSIGYEAFMTCYSLRNVTIGNAVSNMEEYVFSWCGKLETVTIRNGGEETTEIGDYAFLYCSSLSAIAIPDSVSRIGEGAFVACGKLASVTIGKNVVNIGNGAFSTRDEEYAGCSLAAIWVDPENSVYSSDEFGVLFNKDKTTLIKMGEAFSGEYMIPNSVNTIADSAFYDCQELIAITVPDSVIEMEGTFSGCRGLTTVTIEDGVEIIGKNTFSRCRSLTTVTIGKSVREVKADAFYYCESLKDIYYKGTADDWKKIVIGEGNEDLTSATIHYCFSIVDANGTGYETLGQAASAIGQGGVLKLFDDMEENFAVNKTISIDLNGFDILGTVTVEDGCVLYCFDSRTDDYTVNDNDGYGKIAHISGNVQGLPEESDLAEDGYLMITEDDGVSFHRVNLQLTAMTLRPSRVGVYYKSEFAGDEVVAKHVMRYGVALSVNGVPTEENPGVMSWFEGFQAGSNGSDTTSTLLHGIMKPGRTAEKNAAYATMPIYGRAYILTNDGQYLFGSTVSRSLQEQVEAADVLWAELSTQQQTELTTMYQNYMGVMQNWTIPNLQTAISSQVVLLPGKETLIA